MNEIKEDNNEINDKDTLSQAVEMDDEQQVIDIVDNLSAHETLRQASMMSEGDRTQLMSMLEPDSAASLLEEAPIELAANMIEELDSSAAVKIIEELQTNLQADIVQELDTDKAEAIFSEMGSERADDLRKLSQYNPDSAGGLMELDVFSFHKDDTVGTVLKRLTTDDEKFERYRGQHPYIVDDCNNLIGVMSLRSLLRSKRSTKLLELMHSPLSVTTESSHDDLMAIFDENPFLAVPVVDDSGTLVGIVSRTDFAEAELARVEQDSLSRQGVSEELRSMPTLLRSKRRLAWLSSNIVLNIIAASVISAYEETLTAVIAIAIFLPMVSDMSGCSGNQAVGVSMRELTMGLTRPRDLFYVLKKEFSVGIINGIILGILIGIVAWVWKGNAYLGLVIGLALSVNTIIAVSIGGTVPLLLKHFNIDPAVASGPLLTTITDMAGFFLVLSIATFFMPQLLS